MPSEIHPVRLLVRGPTCADIEEVWLLDFLTFQRFGDAEVTVQCDPFYVLLTAIPVPEPSATWLLLAGVGMLGWWSERRVRRGD